MAVDRVRHLRHLTLREIGEAGQGRIAQAHALVPAAGLRGAVARRYAERAGFAEVTATPELVAPSWVAGEVLDESCREVVLGALAALDAIRSAVGPL